MRLIQSVVLFVVALFPWAAAFATITIDTVPVGNVGNLNDPADGDSETVGVQNFGSVSYAYHIGKYEVTIGQYAAFLNAVATTDDPYGLYHVNMASDFKIAGIARTCSPNCAYSVIGSPNEPITYVDWGDAARFTNWLHNGQPSGVEGPGTTETGAYTLNGKYDLTTLSSVKRNADALWFIPSENEWYKAAYYQPTAQGGDSDGYWAYPMKTNNVPYSDQPPGNTPDNTRVGNFYHHDSAPNGYDDGYAVGGSTALTDDRHYLSDVGAYTSSPSYFGTFDQGGNVFEWTEGRFLSSRIQRGGSWWDEVYSLDVSARTTANPGNGLNNQGFRVAALAIPEPSTLALAVGIFAPLAAYRRRRG